MKKIGVISDTHGGQLVLERCIAKASDVDEWFHLGDFTGDAERLAILTGKPVRIVCGNCDGVSKYENELVVTVEETKLLLIHGHRHGIDRYSCQNACYRAEELGCSALFYGHTHVSELSTFGNLIVLNPGSPIFPRAGRKPSFAVVTVDGSRIKAEIITL